MHSISRFARGRRQALAGAVVRRALLGVAAVAVLAVAGISPVAAGDRPPGGDLTNPVVRAIDLASPAVVRIATVYNAHLTLSACGKTTRLPTSGAYIVGGLGSGAFVSAKGDILTADHVVDINRDSLDNEIFAGQRASADIAAFLNGACLPSVRVRPEDVAAGIVQFNGLPFTTSYSAPHILVWQSASYLGVISGSKGKAGESELDSLKRAPYKEATVLKTSAFEQDDLAILHIDRTDTPSIQLGSSSQLAVEDALTVIGFPGNGDFNGDTTNLLIPSVNNVSVSALKRNDNGSQLIQVGGNVEHGDSGGPVLDAAGHIVGVVSFGGTDLQGITAFLRSSDSALTLLSSAHIDTAPGTFQTLWQQAFADYASTAPGHWRKASQEMDALSTRYPDFQGLSAYRAYADTQAVTEGASSGLNLANLPLPLPILAAGTGVVLAVVVLLALLIALRGRAKRRQAREQARQQAMAPQPVWSSAGLPQGFASQASPTRPAMSPQALPSVYTPTYPGHPPQVSAPSNGAGQPPSYPASRPMSGSATYNGNGREGYSGYDGYDGYDGRNAQDGRDGRQPMPSASTQSAGGVMVCANGHWLPEGATRCHICGAERAQSAVSAPPWSQAR
jgi:S1-C subfamily serine protease